MEEAVQRQLLGKRKRPAEWGEAASEAKTPHYDAVREAPVHRVEDGVRIIDVDNIAIDHFNLRDNNESSFMNFEELISQFDYNNGAPSLTGKTGKPVREYYLQLNFYYFRNREPKHQPKIRHTKDFKLFSSSAG